MSAEGTDIPKWQLALLIGVPLAAVAVAGTACLYYHSSKSYSHRKEPSSSGVRPSPQDGAADTEETPIPEVQPQAGEKACDQEPEVGVL